MIQEKYVYQKTYTNYGKVKLTINKMMSKRNINTYKLSVLTGINWGIVKKYAHGDLYRVDLDLLARMCFALDCKLEDLIRYEYNSVYSRNKQEKSKKNIILLFKIAIMLEIQQNL